MEHNCLENRRNILITGATGYIGSMLVKCIQNQNNDNKILAVVRDLQKTFQLLPEGIEFLQTDLCDRRSVEQLLNAGSKVDYIIHCASVTKSAEMIAHPVEVIESIVNTTQNILEFARKGKIKSMVYLSSMEVYGNIDCKDGHCVKEEEVCRGEIEILNTRNCYPMGKRMAENICYSYFKEYGVPVKIARLAQTFGEGVLSSDKRVFAQFAKAVREDSDIVLHTQGDSVGNYCGIHDTILGIMKILEKGVSGEAYNVVNEANTMTIRQMAELVAGEAAEGRIKVRFDIPKENIYGYAADTGLRLSGGKLRKLGWKPTESLLQMYLSVLQGKLK